MNDQSAVPQLWAKQGDVVTCINGHPICTIARDVFLDEPRGNVFTDWQQPEPEKTQTVPSIRCAACRGVWIRQTGRNTYAFHFADGWR
jgi:hypothetical protein